MMYNSNSISKLEEKFSQLYPTPGSNSWAVGVAKGPYAREQESYADRTPKPGRNFWARLDEEVKPLKKPANKPTYALKSMPPGTHGNKPLPLIPELPPPPPYTPRLTPCKSQAHRPHPSFPGAFSSLNFVARLKKHASIKPNRVFADLNRTQLDLKSQVVNDPVILNLEFAHRDEQVLQRQEETTGAGGRAEGSENFSSEISAQPSFANKSTVAQILDAISLVDENQIQLPVFDSPSDISSSSRTTSKSDDSISPVSIVRHLTSETDPTTRHLLENRLTALKISGRHRSRSGILRESAVRKPRRAGTFSETRRVHFAATNDIRRQLSQPRFIENEVCMNNKQDENKGETTIPRPGHSPTEGCEESIACPKSNYSEENQSGTVEPHVRSLPSSPTSVPEHPQNVLKKKLHHPPQRLVAVMPMIDESETDTSPQLQPASPGVWWNAGSRGNSFASSPLHPSMIVAPLFEGQDRINAVPAPPTSSHPDYQPMRPTPPDLAQLELNLHHHIDSGFSSLTKFFSDKTDRILDQLVRRLEALENKVEKNIQNVESQVTEVKMECANLTREKKAILRELDVMRDCVRGLDLKLELISGNIEGNRCRDHYRLGTLSGSESENLDRTQAVPRGSQNRNGHQSLGSDQQSQAQTSFHSSQGRRSSSIDAGLAVGGNESVLAQTEGMNRQPPDLKDHPAFASGQSSQAFTFRETTSGESGSVVKGMLPLFQTPSFRDGGWYKQAYGQ